jgi:two-component system, OmpR family, response regulator ResD
MAQPARVLVVDDEYALRQLLRHYLERDGLAVVEADSGPAALDRLCDHEVDVAVIDVMLPGLDGFELVRRIRKTSDLPVILLTARGEETDRVSGLQLGADDYIVKPFSAPEVVARVRALLRRTKGFDPAPHSVQVGSVLLDLDGRRCTVDGEPVQLTRREFNLLVTLAEQPGRVLNRDQLLQAAWGTTYVSEKTVDVHIAGLRRKLGPGLSISALRGVGYRLEP